MRIRHLLVACVLPAVVACSDRGADADGVDFGWGPRQAEMCMREGGYESRSMGGPFCQFDTADAGRMCHDTSECEGECLAVSRGSEAEAPQAGTRAAGQCSDIRHVFGCQTWIVAGLVKGTVCLD